MYVGGGSAAITVIGNLLGTDASGAQDGNGSDGIEVNGATGVTIVANQSSYNAFNGVRVAAVKGTAAAPTLVRSNVLFGNRTSGVLVHGSTGTTIGGAGFANTIGGNVLSGVRLAAAATGNVVEANYIGTDESGNNLGNAGGGVQITGSQGNVVRGGNTIAYNGTGVRIADTAAATRVVGTRLDANTIASNLGDGVVVAGSANHVIGGIGLGNTIILNGGNGVTVTASSRGQSSGILVRGNLIGTDVSQAPFGNGGDGVRIVGGGGNTVDRNTITDNAGTGVSVAASSSNVIGAAVVGRGNTLALNGEGIRVSDFNGVASVTTRGNSIVGNAIAGSVGNAVTVGGAKTVATTIGAGTVNGRLVGLGNTIFGSGGHAVEVIDGAQQVSIQANSIFDNALGATSLADGTNNGRAVPAIATAQLVYPSRPGQPHGHALERRDRPAVSARRVFEPARRRRARRRRRRHALRRPHVPWPRDRHGHDHEHDVGRALLRGAGAFGGSGAWRLCVGNGDEPPASRGHVVCLLRGGPRAQARRVAFHGCVRLVRSLSGRPESF